MIESPASFDSLSDLPRHRLICLARMRLTREALEIYHPEAAKHVARLIVDNTAIMSEEQLRIVLIAGTALGKTESCGATRRPLAGEASK